MRPTRPLLSVLILLLSTIGFVAIGGSAAEAATGVFSVTAGSDDAEQRPSSVDLSSSDLELVTDGSYQQTVGMRFSGVAIPPGATITDAYIQFTTDENTTAATSLTVVGVDVSNPETFTTAADNISKRSRTDASVPWTPPGWPTPGAAGVDQRTPNLAPIVQEIVNRTSWVSGNPMALLISGTGRRTAKAFEQGAATAPKLNVTWTTSAPPPPVKTNLFARDVSADGDPTLADVQEGEAVTFRAHYTVYDAPPQPHVRLYWFVDGTKVSEGLASSSDPGLWAFNMTNPPTWTATVGAHTVELRVDPLNEVDESNETDNVVSRAFTVLAPPPPPPVNQAPTVSAGPDQTVTLPASANLDGTVSDDGQPAGSSVTQSWSKVSGPGTVTFGSPNAADTTASFSAAGTYVLRLTGSDGALTASDDVQVTANPAAPPPPPPGPTFPACTGSGRNVVQPFPPGTVRSTQWKVASPPNDTTYDLTGFTSTAYPNGSASPIALGNTTAPNNLCILNGTVAGTTDDAQSWEYYHETHNASCVRAIAVGWVQLHNFRCHDIEDGLKFQESSTEQLNINVTSFYSSGVWLDRVRDDCMENDYTLGGVLYDSLWERCNTGLSERPSSSNGSWTSPSNETVTLDHMLIGLWATWHATDSTSGHNAIFKWSTSGNKPVIKCSTFYVPQVSLNGADSMDFPVGTTVDDSACPNDPTTIVWTGGGAYPGNLQGLPIQVVSDKGYWDAKVASWKAAHGV